MHTTHARASHKLTGTTLTHTANVAGHTLTAHTTWPDLATAADHLQDDRLRFDATVAELSRALSTGAVEMATPTVASTARRMLADVGATRRTAGELTGKRWQLRVGTCNGGALRRALRVWVALSRGGRFAPALGAGWGQRSIQVTLDPIADQRP